MTKAGSDKWKIKLLSSSIPLEFEVARLMARRGFSVAADFPYLRDDGGIAKEFSVDIVAGWLTSKLPKVTASCWLSLLVECKYRRRGISWFFLPDPESGPLTFTSSGNALRVVDEFSPWFAHRSPDYFDRVMPRAYKGTEIDGEDGAVDDSRVRHGLSQLQHALPAILAERIRGAASQHPDDNAPFLYSAVLVTNAPLILAHRQLGMKQVEQATSVSEVGTLVPYLSVHVETGPQFEQHVASQCGQLLKDVRNGGFKDVDARRKAGNQPEYCLPSTLAVSLAAGHPNFSFNHPLNQIVVCNVAYLTELIGLMKEETIKVNRSIRTHFRSRRHLR
jgi:hypothetical protein